MTTSSNVKEFMEKSILLFLAEVIIAVCYEMNGEYCHARMNWIRLENFNTVFKRLTSIDYKYSLNKDVLNRVERLGTYLNSNLGFEGLIEKSVDATASVIIMMIFATQFDAVNIKWILVIFTFIIIEVIISTILSNKINKLRDKIQVYNRKKKYYANIMTIYNDRQTLEVNEYLNVIVRNYEQAYEVFYKLQKKEIVYNTLNQGLAVVLKYGLMAVLLGYFITQFGTANVAGIWLIVNVTTTFSGLMDSILAFVYKASVDQKMLGIYRQVDAMESITYDTTKRFKIKKIEFKNVSFKYEHEWILKDCSFALEAGRKYALIGRNGSGKTTITNLLLGFSTANEGQILINGKDIIEYDIAAIRASIGTIFQETNLFPTSLNDNISLDSNSRVDITDEDIVNFDILKKYSLDTELTKSISEDGVILSGGEENQVAMLRALKKKASMFIFDEPNSSLDMKSEKQMYYMLDNLFAGKFLLMITHRMEACKHVDEIMFLKDGSISERGSHNQLISVDYGDYASFCKLQSNIRIGADVYE